MTTTKIKAFIGLLFFSNSTMASQDPIVYDNRIYEPEIKTVILQNNSTTSRFPLISLGEEGSMSLQFDQMVTTNEYFQYTFIHCNQNWEPTALDKGQFIIGNRFQEVSDFSYSNGTIQKYVHYQFNFPSSEMSPKLSGNYLLLVYRNYDEKDIVITRRFMVMDPRVRIEMKTHGATAVADRFKNQEIDFTVNLNGYRVPNPNNDLKAYIYQNNRWDNSINALKPLFINGQNLNYDYNTGNNFVGGNEFRFFDIRSLRKLSFNVRRKYLDENGQKHVVLNYEAMTGTNAYQRIIDYNGNMVIDNKDNDGGKSEGDYVYVHFTLYSSKQLSKGDVYVFGEVSNWQKNDSFKMTYNESLGAYELTALIKQAYVSYCFVVDNTTTGKLETADTEGDHFETENTYRVVLYHKNQSMFYDEIIGAEIINSASGQR